LGSCAFYTRHHKRIFVVRNGNIDVGNKTAPRKAAAPKISGAMSQQCADSGNASSPQKLVHLVGCRDPKARPEPWVRTRAAPPKR
jgi:hypothetical protein